MNFALLTFVLIILLVGTVYYLYERRRLDVKELTMVATLATLAGVSRIPFAFVAGFQPTTFTVMISGYVFGSHLGFMVGSLAALISNFFLGQGPWTPWQMVCWGSAGFFGGVLGRRKANFSKKSFALLCLSAGYGFGWGMNIWHWLGFVYPLNLQTFLATYIASFPFDTIHAIGNLLFTILFGQSFYNILTRFKRRLYVDRLPS